MSVQQQIVIFLLWQVWEGVMASTAAPGYFEEVKLGPYVHQVRRGVGGGGGGEKCSENGQ